MRMGTPLLLGLALCGAAEAQQARMPPYEEAFAAASAQDCARTDTAAFIVFACKSDNWFFSVAGRPEHPSYMVREHWKDPTSLAPSGEPKLEREPFLRQRPVIESGGRGRGRSNSNAAEAVRAWFRSLPRDWRDPDPKPFRAPSSRT